MRDPKQFKNPNQFDPTNFLDTNGQFVRNQAMLAFSAGRRNCVGEPFARATMFLLMAKLIQQFKLKPSGEDPSKMADIKIADGITRVMEDYEICAISRE